MKKDTRTYIVGLSTLRSGRYESKATFSKDYVSNNCPLFYFEELSEHQQADIINHMRLIMAVCNKFLQKPIPATSILVDLLENIDADSNALLIPQKTDLSHIMECIGFAYISDTTKTRYLKMKGKLYASDVAMRCYGEICNLMLYTEDLTESLVYGMLYANYPHVSYVILMELVVKLWDAIPQHLRFVITKAVEDLVDLAFEYFASNYEDHSGNILKFEVLQQIAFLGSLLEYKLKRVKPTKFLHNLDNYPLMLIHTNNTDNNVLTYNLGLFNEREDEPLCTAFSLNYSSWIQYYLKVHETVSPSEGLAALLISLNLNFDNQLCWNLLARFMMKNDYLKFSLQALNMSKVFKIGQDNRETEYLISLWMKLLRKAESANIKADFGHEDTVGYIKSLLRSLSGPHQVFLKAKKEEEMAFVKPNMTKKVDLSLQGIRNYLVASFSKKFYKKALKLAYLYVLKIDRLATVEEKKPYWAEILGCLKDMKLIQEVILIGKEILGMTAGNGPEKAEITKEMIGTLGTIAFWFTRSELQADNDIFWKTILNSMTAFITSDFQSLNDAVSYLSPKHKIPEVVKSLVFSVMKLVSQKERISSDEQCQALLTLAKKSLVACPHSQNIRLLYNDVLLYAGNCQGLLLAANEDGKKIPAQFPTDFRLMEIFRSDGKATHTFEERTSSIKIGLLQYPNNKFYQKSVQTMIKIRKEKNSKPTGPAVTPEEAFKLCQKEKDNILTTHFGVKSDLIKNLLHSTNTLWNKHGSGDLKKSAAIKRLAAIDNLVLLILMSHPPKTLTEDQKEELLGDMSKIVLDNTILDSVYFVTYLHFLYFRQDWESIEAWVGVLSFLKIKPEAEFFVNFSLMVKKIKDVQSGEDDAEETKDLINDLGQYFDECPVDELKESAKYILLLYSKYVAKDKGLIEIREEAEHLIRTNPEKFKALLEKHLS